MQKKMAFVLVLLLSAVQYVLAHDVWIANRGDKLVVVYGHGGKFEPYDPQKVKDAKAFGCGAKAVAVEVGRQEDGVTIDSKEQPATVTAFFDSGCWVQTTDGWKNLGKRDAQGKFSVVEAQKSRKYAKALLTPCDGFSKPMGLAFEIVPEIDPFAVKTGERIPLKVLLDGKPVEGAVITTGDAGHSRSADLPRSDKEGKASATITKPGFQLIVASFKTPITGDPDADVLSLSTALTFEVR
jgi:nickel transport protein